MKVVTSKEMKNLESQAYRDGASEQEFMEEAGSGVALVVHDYAEHYQRDKQIILLCGKGNNAGDAYVAGIHLLHLDYEVFALQLFPIKNCSLLCQKNFHRFLEEGGHVREVHSVEEFTLPEFGIIVDGLFGTGFQGEIKEPYASIIKAMNKSELPIIAIDIPSGLNGDTGIVQGEAIKAVETAFLGLPKTGFFLREGWNHVGKLAYIDFGLDKEYIEQSKAELIMISADMGRAMLPKIKRNRHKYEAGEVVGLAGSPNMPGAAVLSAFSALRGGAGIVRMLYPEGMQAELSGAPFELIKIPYRKDDEKKIIDLLNKAKSVFIGPGLGLNDEVRSRLKAILPSILKPCVLDADALTIIAEEGLAIPKNAVLTPHHGEMNRLLKLSSPPAIGMDYLKICQNFADEHHITLVLKGGPSFIFHPDEPILVNSSGDPGMATAGSGDVLTGLIASLLAQGLAPRDAAALGVFLHGLAGEFSAEVRTSYCMVASDIIEFFPEAFAALY